VMGWRDLSPSDLLTRGRDEFKAGGKLRLASRSPMKTLSSSIAAN